MLKCTAKSWKKQSFHDDLSGFKYLEGWASELAQWRADLVVFRQVINDQVFYFPLSRLEIFELNPDAVETKIKLEFEAKKLGLQAIFG